MRELVGLIFFLFCLSAAIVYGAGIQAQTAAVNEDSPLPDFMTLRDPFESALPKAQIIKTPIELPRQSYNNSSQVNETAPVKPNSIAPVPRQKRPLPPLVISGIVWERKQPQAIVNNTVVGVGDEISGVKIQSIHKSEIVVLFEGDKIHVQMEQ